MNKVETRKNALAKITKLTAKKKRIDSDLNAAKKELADLYPDGGSWQVGNNLVFLTNEVRANFDHHKALAAKFDQVPSHLKDQELRFSLFADLYDMDIEPYTSFTEYMKIAVK